MKASLCGEMGSFGAARPKEKHQHNSIQAMQQIANKHIGYYRAS
jgi:hypothetical protein